MKTSERGIDLIKRFEELRLEAYLCPAGVWTIGYGATKVDGKPVKKGMELESEEQADELLALDIAAREKTVAKLVKVPLTQGEFDALVSFEFNTGALAQSTLLKLLNAGDRTAAADQFPRWNKGTVKSRKVTLAGLTRRRRDERALFLGRAA